MSLHGCRIAYTQVLTSNLSLIAFTDKEPKDFMVPSRWGTVSIPRSMSMSCYS